MTARKLFFGLDNFYILNESKTYTNLTDEKLNLIFKNKKKKKVHADKIIHEKWVRRYRFKICKEGTSVILAYTGKRKELELKVYSLLKHVYILDLQRDKLQWESFFIISIGGNRYAAVPSRYFKVIMN